MYRVVQPRPNVHELDLVECVRRKLNKQEVFIIDTRYVYMRGYAYT